MVLHLEHLDLFSLVIHLVRLLLVGSQELIEVPDFRLVLPHKLSAFREVLLLLLHSILTLINLLLHAVAEGF